MRVRAARLAHRCLDILDLVVAETPLEPVQITEAAHWHPRRETEPAVVWLRRLLYDVAVAVEDAASTAPSPVLQLAVTGDEGEQRDAVAITSAGARPRGELAAQADEGEHEGAEPELGEAEDRAAGTRDRAGPGPSPGRPSCP